MHVSLPPFWFVLVPFDFPGQTGLTGQGQRGRGALHVVVGKSEQQCPFSAWLWGGGEADSGLSAS